MEGADSARIVSLLPSATEIVASLGFADRLVGRSHECDFPPGVETLPVLTAPKLDPGGSSRAIHESVTRILAKGLSVYDVDAPLLASLAPTHVVTQVHCEVCAVSLRDVRAAAADWPGHIEPPAVVALGASTLDEVRGDFLRVGLALGVPERAQALGERLRGRVETIAQRSRAVSRRPRVAAIEWLDPLMAAGNWIPEMIEMAGGENLFGAKGEHSPWLEPEVLVAASPDVVVVFPCGFPLARGLAEAPSLFDVPGFAETPAARSGSIFVADGHQLFNRPGPRLAESLEVLAEILHPEIFDFGRQEFWASTSELTSDRS
jgi:iron complex transport system substrate-binding protein